MNKPGLRKLFQEKRNALNEQEQEKLLDQVIQQILLLPLDTYRLVHIFLPIRKKKEIDTFRIIDALKANYPNLQICVPRSDFSTHTLTHVLYNGQSELRENEYGITEPVNGVVTDPREIDIVFTPLLAFDKKGYRVGYGKGFYDRFLAECKPDVIKTGLSFFDAVDEISDVNAFDIRLDHCITPEKIYSFNQ